MGLGPTLLLPIALESAATMLLCAEELSKENADGS